jgi:hypothetical protein
MYKLIIILIVFAQSIYGQSGNPIPPAQYYFGFKIFDSGTGDLVRYGIAKVASDGKIEFTPLRKEMFFLQAAGKMESLANPEALDFWAKHQVYWRTVDQIWKLKYAEYPYERSEDTEGWAQLAYAPSRGQLEFLSKYGIKKDISDLVYGELCFKLLQDIQNPEWQYEYATK